MSIYRNWDNRKAGGVLQNAHPKVHPFAWQATQRNVRENPQIPSQPQRIQPHERGTFYPTSASAGGTLAPSMSSGCVGCDGCNGNGMATVPTASDIAASHSLPTHDSMKITMSVVPIKPAAPVAPRLLPRAVGALRPAMRSNSFSTGKPSIIGRANLMTGRGMRP